MVGVHRGRSVLRFVAFGAALVPLWQLSACSNGPVDGGSGGAGPAVGGTTGSGASTTGSGAATGSGGFTTGSPNWSEDLAPLIYRECVSCHREGEVAPFGLETYEQAVENAIALAVETEERQMPPMPVDGSGECNTFSNARWLTQEEIDLFAEWLEVGTPQGDPSLAPPLPAAPLGLESPDLTLDPGVEYTPNAALVDDYRCFIIDPGLTAEKFIVAYEVIPGDARVVHHAIVYEPDSDLQADEAVALDDAEAGAGYTCFGGPGIDAEPRVLWAPGGGFIQLPEDTGVPLAAGRKQILQVHYNLEHGSFPDRTTVKLTLADTVPFEAWYQPVADLDMVLDPGLELASTSTTLPALGAAFKVHGVMPHMHTLGRELNVTVDADGADHCLVDVDRWDFHSQNAWWYAEPLTFDAVQSATITCAYDTTDRTEQVTWGEGTDDEMCLTYLYVTTPE